MMMAYLFLSFLFLGLFQLLPLNLLWRRLGAFGLFVLQAWLWWKLFSTPGVQVLNVGDWPHYAGIVWLSDSLSLIFSAAAIFLFFPAYMYLLYKRPEDRWLLCLIHFFAASLVGAFFTADLFNLFVMFEILLLSSYTFFARAEKLTAGKLYIWANILGSALFLIAVAYLYKSLGTVSFGDIAIRFQALNAEQASFLYWMFVLIFLFKAGLWPLLFWMPSSYPSLPSSLLAFFAVLSSKVGLYAFVRWTSLVGWEPFNAWRIEFQILCAASIILAGAAAFTANNLRSSLAYWSLSHIGLMVLGLSLSQPLGVSALIVYFLQDVVVAAGLFYFCDAHEDAKSPRQIFSKTPLAAVVFILLALSASGFPLTSGFWGKLLFLKASLSLPFAFLLILSSALLFLGLSVSLWNRYFVGEAQSPQGASNIRLPWQVFYCLGASVICIWLGTSKVPELRQRVEEVLKPANYVSALIEATQQVELRRQSGDAQP